MIRSRFVNGESFIKLLILDVVNVIVVEVAGFDKEVVLFLWYDLIFIGKYS